MIKFQDEYPSLQLIKVEEDLDWLGRAVTLFRKDAKTSYLWVLLEDYYIEWEGSLIVVPEGFVTDGPSIPSRLRSIVPVRGNQWPAAIGHDWLYVDQPNGISRKDADDFFAEGLKEWGVNAFTRNLMYAAVRAGGWPLWYDDE